MNKQNKNNKKENKKTTEKPRLKQKNTNIYFEVILIIILIPILTLTLVSLFKTDKAYKGYYSKDSKNVNILTDKNVYVNGEKINLTIKNNENQSIYFEPCEYLNNFEKKINGEWKKEDATVNDNYYNQTSFNKNKSVTKCEIKLPESGEGVYRSVIQIYYSCIKPGYCENSKTFYSNEFKVVDSKNDFCEDKVLEDCDGKRVSVIGTFITSKAHFLSEIENREVKYQWAGEIMIDDSEGMKEGERYKVIGIVRKGGQPCGMNNEQCMLDEKGVILPYPTKIEVEKIYPVK